MSIDADTTLLLKQSEWRYTLGPLYMPNKDDKHGEFVSDEELHKAVIAYAMQSDKRLRLQHDESREVGTVVEIMRWPYPVRGETTVGGVRKSVSFPAGSVFLGVIWDPEYWPLVKSGRVRGYSMGGRALRVRETGQTQTVEVEKEPVGKARGSLVQLAARHGSLTLR